MIDQHFKRVVYAAVERAYMNLANGGEEFSPEEWDECLDWVKDELLRRI